MKVSLSGRGAEGRKTCVPSLAKRCSNTADFVPFSGLAVRYYNNFSRILIVYAYRGKFNSC